MTTGGRQVFHQKSLQKKTWSSAPGIPRLAGAKQPSGLLLQTPASHAQSRTCQAWGETGCGVFKEAPGLGLLSGRCGEHSSRMTRIHSHCLLLRETIPSKHTFKKLCCLLSTPHLFYREGNGNPLQCSCLENPVDRRTWGAAVYGVARSRARLKRLSSSTYSKPFLC